MSINKDLEDLYRKYWDQLLIDGNIIIQNNKKKNNHPANPLLLKVNEEKYESADIKVMVFGQETWGWQGSFAKSVMYLMDRYDIFFNKENFYKNRSISAFWKGFDFFKDEITKYYSQNDIVILWNNISKIGRYEAKGTTSEIRNLEQNSFPVIKEEMNILKPDIVVFLTGNRDDDIRFHYPDVCFKKYRNRNNLTSKSGKIKFKPAYKVISKDLPSRAVKLYHPSYFGGFNKIKNDAIEIILK